MTFKPLNENIQQCTATSRSTGRRCENPAVNGYTVCRLHGAHKKRSPNDPPKKTKSGRHSNVIQKYKNKLNKTAEELGVDLSVGLKHGFLAFDILTPEERQDFLSVVKQMHEDFQLNKSSDFYATELVATNLILFRRAVKNDDVKAAEAYDRMVRMHLSDLKATKSAREGDTINVKTTPAEWAASILKRVEEEEAQELAGGGGAFSEESKNSVAFDEGDDANKSDKTKTFEE
ncbi:MAG: hypothetical protein BWY28_03065 [bacterium ADurb.Bin236]|nr:MAG: hypothetical protein BWY28_03065 [bacterium ADurb.Bin236]